MYVIVPLRVWCSRHGLARATIRALILGPEFLAYNLQQVEIEHFKNIWVKTHFAATFSVDQLEDDECDELEP